MAALDLVSDENDTRLQFKGMKYVGKSNFVFLILNIVFIEEGNQLRLV